MGVATTGFENVATAQTFVAIMKKLKIIHYLFQNPLPTSSRDVKTIISLLCMKHRLYINFLQPTGYVIHQQV
jgi:hypothetical protein